MCLEGSHSLNHLKIERSWRSASQFHFECRFDCHFNGYSARLLTRYLNAYYSMSVVMKCVRMNLFWGLVPHILTVSWPNSYFCHGIKFCWLSAIWDSCTTKFVVHESKCPHCRFRCRNYKSVEFNIWFTSDLLVLSVLFVIVRMEFQQYGIIPS